MGTPLRAFLFLTALLLATLSAATVQAAPRAAPVEVAVGDPALESRLEIERFYRTRKGETLRSVARLLYGHDTWWSKLQALNPGMKGLNPDWQLPGDTRIKYLAAKVGTEYVVQPGDWLVRIATWKYGDAHEWEKVYRENASAIANPNLIHPGDRLAFRADGTMYNATTKQVVLNGLPAEPLETPDRAPASSLQAPEPEGLSMAAWFGIGALAGLLVYFMLVYRRRWAPVTTEAPAHAGLHLNADEIEDTEETAEPDLNEMYQEMTRDGYYRTFRRRPPEEYRVDTSLVRYEEGEAARPTGYQSIVPKKLKKYLALKKQK